MKLRKSDEGLKPSELRAVPRLNTKNMGVLYVGGIYPSYKCSAITYEIAYQCTLNKIPGCGCPWPSPSWIKCGDSVAFGRKTSRHFTDRRKKRHDAQTVVNLHNNAVGREVTNLKLFTESAALLLFAGSFVCTDYSSSHLCVRDC